MASNFMTPVEFSLRHVKASKYQMFVQRAVPSTHQKMAYRYSRMRDERVKSKKAPRSECTEIWGASPARIYISPGQTRWNRRPQACRTKRVLFSDARARAREIVALRRTFFNHLGSGKIEPLVLMAYIPDPRNIVRGYSRGLQ